MKNPASVSRRGFLARSGILLAGTAVSLNGLAGVQSEPIIDIHQHTDYMGRTHDQLIAHQRAMGVTTTILLPAGTPAFGMSTHKGESNGLQAKCSGNETCYNLARQHPTEFRFGANEVPDLPDATVEIEKYLKRGAPIIGESKFGVKCDSPEMQRIYELAQSYRVPVLMHWQYGMYNHDFARFHTMVEKYPKVNFIGHAQTWWANIDKGHQDQTVLYPKTSVTPGGITDRLLSDYPNVYADMSAGSGLNALLRDEEHTRGFLDRHQNKILYGSDCLDTAGHGPTCQGSQTIAAIRRLSPSKTIERKILYENSKKLFRL
ncbi:amidohydrolase family protein [Larkinella sp.]|uniref:amidohydrolase family protein n=1 Tax=Larkinella sp. TaxID=2034517 RepID=UPI003BAD2F66